MSTHHESHGGDFGRTSQTACTPEFISPVLCIPESMPGDTWSSNATIPRLYGLLARSVGPHVNKIHGNGSMVAETKPNVLRAQAPVSPWNTVMRLGWPLCLALGATNFVL